jgi:2-aminobenzoate-CoA ligase
MSRDNFCRAGLPPPDTWPALINLGRFGYPPRLNCAVELLDRAVHAGAGDHIAIYSDAGALTYAGLLTRVNRLAQMLTGDLGLLPGERVLLRAPNCAPLAAAWLAVAKAGGVVVTTMPLLRAGELAKILTKARPRVALCHESLEGELAAAQRDCPVLQAVIHFNSEGRYERPIDDKDHDFHAVDTGADDVCIIAFTSGTTGVPKGTLHFHRDVLAVCDTFPRSILGTDALDIFIGTPPLGFTYGLGALLLFPLRARAAAVLLEQPAPERLLDAIQSFRATTLFSSPTGYRQLLDVVRHRDLSSLHTCVAGGEHLPLATFAAWRDATGLDLVNGLGSTEMLHIFASARGADIRPGAVGRAVPGYELAILDESLQPLPPGQLGRLAVRGPTGCRYLSDPRQSEYVQGGWNITGDAGHLDGDGYLWHEGRCDDLIISGGYNIAGIEVEEALLQHPDVRECAVVGVPDAARGQIVKAVVVLRDPSRAGDATRQALQEHVKRRLAPYKYPRAIAFMDALPRTETGKVQRHVLRHGNSQPAVAPVPGT